MYLRRRCFGGVPLSFSLQRASRERRGLSSLWSWRSASALRLRSSSRLGPGLDAPRPALDSASGVPRPLPIRGGKQAIGSRTWSAQGAELVGLCPRCLGPPVHLVGSRRGFCSNLYPGCQWDCSSRVWSNPQGSLRPAVALHGGWPVQELSVRFSAGAQCQSPLSLQDDSFRRRPGCILCPRAGAGETPTSAERALEGGE